MSEKPTKAPELPPEEKTEEDQIAVEALAQKVAAIRIGSRVKLHYRGDDPEDDLEYLLIGHDNQRGQGATLSIQSSLGAKILGKFKGETITVVTPQETNFVTILSVDNTDNPN